MPSHKRFCSFASVVMLNLFLASSLVAQQDDVFPFTFPHDVKVSNAATDFSYLNESPAGSDGFVRIVDGHFANDKGRLRIWGVNFCFGANFPQHADAERESVGFASVIGQSDAICRVIDQAKRVARHDNVTILIEGETGTGKEVLARAIHYHGPRAAGPFVEVNCTAIPENLLESELFGHERGSFTGAIATKQGLFELAHGGTLLLDEIGHLPLELQAKLLRALESREIRRVGGNKTRAVDVRVLAATHVRLSQAMARGEFREDLFYRLNVVSLRVPPLRERNGDIELLAERFVSDLASHHGLPVPALTPEVHSALRSHQWPGNVRELRNAIERALVLSPPGTLDLDELWLERDDRPVGEGTESLLPFPAPLESIIRAAVAAMVELTRGNKSEAARMLGISRPRLQRWLGEGDDADGPTDR